MYKNHDDGWYAYPGNNKKAVNVVNGLVLIFIAPPGLIWDDARKSWIFEGNNRASNLKSLDSEKEKDLKVQAQFKGYKDGWYAYPGNYKKAVYVTKGNVFIVVGPPGLEWDESNNRWDFPENIVRNKK